MKKERIFLFLILGFFLFTRFYKISQIPPSVYWDEASIGYNAYSVLQDGRDEWGNFLPLHFRAFGEFKLPVYIYSVAISEKLFGLNSFSVRLPSVIYSAFSLILVYLISKKIFSGSSGLLSALVFSACPWYFIFSRTGYEVSAGLFFFLLGTYFFLKTEKKNYFFPFGILSFILSFYSYNSFRILIPIFLLVFGLAFILRKDVKTKAKLFYIVSGIVLFLLVLFPVYRLYKFDAGGARLTQVQVSGAADVFKNYLSHFSPQFLFNSGDSNSRSSVPGFGELFPVIAPFLIIGTFVIFKKKQKFWWLPFLAILLGPIPAAVTRESPHALRAILMIPFLSMVAGVGIDSFAGFFGRAKKMFIFGVLFLLAVSFKNYFIDFTTKYSSDSSAQWQFGYKKIFEDYLADFAEYDKVVISDAYAQPYIFGLFYQKYDPGYFRQSVVYNTVDQWGFSTVKSFDKFLFKKVTADDLSENSIVFATVQDKINDEKPVEEIKNPDGTTAFWVYTK